MYTDVLTQFVYWVTATLAVVSIAGHIAGEIIQHDIRKHATKLRQWPRISVRVKVDWGKIEDAKEADNEVDGASRAA